MRDLQFEYFDLNFFQRRWKIASVHGKIESKSICGRQKFENIFLLFLLTKISDICNHLFLGARYKGPLKFCQI